MLRNTPACAAILRLRERIRPPAKPLLPGPPRRAAARWWPRPLPSPASAANVNSPHFTTATLLLVIGRDTHGNAKAMRDETRTDHGVCLRIDRDQFGLLLEMTALARWVVTAGERFTNAAYRQAVDALEQGLLEQALMLGGAEWVYASETDGRLGHLPFEDGDSPACDALHDHDNEVFWQQLIDGLSPILARRECGALAWQQLDPQQQFHRVCECETRIRDAFDRHGLACLMLATAEAAE